MAKRQIKDVVAPLDADTVQHVLNFIPLGHGPYVSSVSKAWQCRYRSLGTMELTIKVRLAAALETIGLDHRTVCLGSVFAAPLKLQLAVKMGLQLQSSAVQYAAGLWADCETLPEAHRLGMPWSTEVTDGATRAGDLVKLQWLCARPCPTSGILCILGLQVVTLMY